MSGALPQGQLNRLTLAVKSRRTRKAHAVRFTDAPDPDERTRSVATRVQDEGTCWMSGTTWHGQAAMRISVSNCATTPEDIERSVAAILRCSGVARS